MAISPLVTGGFGSFGSIPLIITFGYGIGQAVVVRQTGASYLTDEEYQAYLARLRTLDNARKRARRKERQKWQRIREAMDETLNPKPAAAPDKPSSPSPQLQQIRHEIGTLRAKIAEFEAEQDEDDFETLLILAA